MSRVKVSQHRSWIGVFVTVCAIFLLGTIVLVSRESTPPEPTPVAKLAPTSTPTTAPEQPTTEPTQQLQVAQFPDAYVLTKNHSAITIRDLETGQQHYTFGVGDEFDYQAGHVIIQRDRNARVIEYATGHIRWEGALIEPFDLLLGYIVRPEYNQFIIASYINPINTQLRLTTYELDTNQALDQATFELATSLIFIPGISSNGELFMHNQQELIRYDLATKTQTKLLIPELKGRMISAVTKHPSQDMWYIIDDRSVLYQLTFTLESNQPIIETLTDLHEEKLYETIDLLATEQGLFFVADLQIRSRVLFYYDFLSAELIEHEIDQDIVRLTRDPIEQGVWISSYFDEHTRYWDGKAAINDKLPFESSKVISIEPNVPIYSFSSVALTPSSAPQPQIQPDSTPFIWIRESSLNVEPDSPYITSTIKTLAPDGNQTTVATNVIAAFERPNVAPLLLIEDQGYQLFDPEQQTYLPIEEPITSFIDRGYYTEQPHVPESLYLVNLDRNAVAWIGTSNKDVEQLIITDLKTGAQAIYPFTLPGEFLRNEYVHLLGWHQSMIYFMHEENQIWQLNLEDSTSTLLQKTTQSFGEIIYIPQSQQIAFTSDDPSFQAHFNIYNIPQNRLEPVPRFESFLYLSDLQLEPTRGLLSFIAYSGQDQATLMVQAQADQLRFIPVYTFDYSNIISTPRSNVELWVDKHTLQLHEETYYSMGFIIQAWLTKITTIDLESDTLSQRFLTMDLAHQSQQAFILKDTMFLDQGNTRLDLVQVPLNSTEPSIVLSIESTPGSSFIDVFYIPE